MARTPQQLLDQYTLHVKATANYREVTSTFSGSGFGLVHSRDRVSGDEYFMIASARSVLQPHDAGTLNYDFSLVREGKLFNAEIRHDTSKPSLLIVLKNYDAAMTPLPDIALFDVAPGLPTILHPSHAVPEGARVSIKAYKAGPDDLDMYYYEGTVRHSPAIISGGVYKIALDEPADGLGGAPVVFRDPSRNDSFICAMVMEPLVPIDDGPVAEVEALPVGYLVRALSRPSEGG